VGGVTWMKAKRICQHSCVDIYYGANSDATTGTIVVTYASVETSLAVNISEYSGVATNNPFLTTQANSGIGSTATTTVISPTSTNVLVIANSSNVEEPIISGPTGFFAPLQGAAIGSGTGSMYLGTAYRIFSATSTYSTSWTAAAADGYDTLSAAFVGSQAAGTQVSSRSDTLSDSRPSATVAKCRENELLPKFLDGFGVADACRMHVQH
jgi:hypothetical protein